MRWLTLPLALLAALALWTLGQAQGELSITLEPLDDYCESTEADSGTTEVRWTVTGGQKPYEVWIAGELQQGTGTSGVATVQCVGLRGRDIWIGTKRSGPLNIVATAEDANGVRASALAWVERLVEVQPLRWVDNAIYGGDTFIGPGWFRVDGHSFWVPEGEWEAQDHAESQFEDERQMLTLHGPGLRIRLDRETGQELERDPDFAEAEYAAANAQIDQVVASVGSAPSRSTMTFAGRTDTLSLELFAPAVCEASRWDGTRRNRLPRGYRDHVAAEIEWRISGGQEPYRLHIAEDVYEGASGRLRIPCQAFANGVADSGLISVAALVEDANGATGSGIVQTYAVARTSGERYSETRLMNGGRTYSFENVVMTIPHGLTIDISDGYEVEHVSCAEHACTSATCANELNDNVCEDSFTVWTSGGSVSATFGYKTRKMSGRGWIRDDWRDDPGVSANSEAEIRQMMNAWADSVGKAPDLSELRWVNPAPLQVSGYFTNLNCRVEWYEEELWANFTIDVSGGAWVPTGIEVRQPGMGGPQGSGQLVGLARGRDSVLGSFPCPDEAGWQAITLNVHDVAPDEALAEVDIHALNLPARHTDGSLQIRATAWQSEHEETPYCEPGSDALLKWELIGLVEPFTIWINGEQQGWVEVGLRNWQTGAIGATGHVRVPCLDRTGLQVHTIYAIDGSPTPQWVKLPIVLEALAEHPSGRPWSDLRDSD